MRAIRTLLAVAVLAVICLGPGAVPAGAATTTSVLPPIGHVWDIVLENSDFLQTFLAGTNGVGAPHEDPYVAQTLPSMGALVVDYFGTGHNSLDNYITMTSGQLPNDDDKTDCTDGSLLGGSTPTADGGAGGLTERADGQWVLPRLSVGGVPTTQPDTTTDGCVFPEAVKSLADQLEAAHISWKGYMEDMDASPSTARTTCQYAGSAPYAGQPSEGSGHFDDYARKHDPFEYYHSFTDQQAYCDAHDVALGYEGADGPTTAGGALSGPLATDLASADPPQYSFITPDLCDDAHDQTCTDPANSQGGLARVNTWLPPVIDAITASPAYKRDGLIMVTLDEGDGDPSACCGEAKGPNLPPGNDNGTYSVALGDSTLQAGLANLTGGGLTSATGPGGGQIGAIMLSPFITPGTVDTTGMYNHCSYLRSMEDIFHIGPTAAIPGSDGQGHLACAGQVDETGIPGEQVADFGYAGDIWTSATATPPSSVPETTLAVALPLVGVAVIAYGVPARRRRRREQRSR